MHRFTDFKNLMFSRRSFILVIIQCFIVFFLAIRLFFLQIIKSKTYTTLSENNRIKFFLLEPKRGIISDNVGVVLAENRINYQLYFYKQKNQNYDEVLRRVSSMLNFDANEISVISKLVKNSSYLYPVLIQDNLSWNQVIKIESDNHNLSGAYVSKGYMRYYPMKRMFAHTVGYVGIPTKEEADRYLLQNVGAFRIGKTGIEKEYNQKLIGEFGFKKVEVNAYRSVIRELDQEQSSSGQDMSITINQKLQERVYNLLSDNGGAAVVMNVKTGEILSMVSKPSFDPNLFSSPISHNDWGEIIKNRKHPLNNRTISTLYPPGSIWKAVTALAILNKNLDTKKTVYCSGSTKVGTQEYKCWKKGGHGNMDLNQALMHSCNIYFYEIGREAGIDAIHHAASSLGFGMKTGVNLPGELEGVNPSRSWKEKTYDSSWRIGDTINSAIGQGYDLVTPIQIASMMARLSTGFKVKPILYCQDSTDIKREKLNIPERNLEILRESMSNVFNHRDGNGYSARIKEQQFMLAGKSGTAQVVSGDTATASNRKIKSHSVFAGYAPVHDPKYAIAVVSEHAGWGMVTSAPIAIDILYFAQTKL